MITITALKWAPTFAAGQVRDHRARWILEEVGWPYEVRLLDQPELKSQANEQPFWQVPVLEEEGRPPLFETGAIVLDVAMRAGRLIPPGEVGRAQAMAWVFAALNSVEPLLMNVAEVEYFMDSEEAQRIRRPVVRRAAEEQLALLEQALGDRAYLLGEEFTVADLMMASVLKGARRLDLMGDTPRLKAYQDRCLDRPAYRKAVGDQERTIAAHGPRDMRYDEAGP